MESFDIITLDAKKMLERIRSDAVKKKADGNFGIRVCYDLSAASKEKEIILREENYSFDDDGLSNALFDQLLKVVPSEDLIQSFLYIDFKNIFSKKDFWELPTKEILSEAELYQDSKSARGYKLKTMFKDGIELSFDGKHYKHFVPFDKSSNNARHCVISFVDEKVKSELEPRLMLGMDLSKLRLPLSKYYAYRGLYLSSARRIESESIVLNAQTVIVLKDFPQTIHNANVFTATENASDATWKFEPTQQNFSLNLFDGEGIISPEYSKAINACLKKMLKHKYKGDSHSFQIRLPFTKGVLHEVDFVKFFREKLNISSMKIKDVFGRERDLSKAHIILTESMFKCSSWIANENMNRIAAGDRPVSADPMENFFNGIEYYGHALYVAMTDVNLSNNGTVRLNYQFLSTLQFGLDDFQSLIDEHIKKIEDTPNILKEIFSEASIDEIDNEEDFDSSIDNDELDELTDSDADADTDSKNDSAPKKDLQTDDADDKPTESNARKKIFRVLARNDAFLKETKVRSAISDFQRDKQRDLFLGHFNIQGEQRFLSCDLLGFLLRIAERFYGDKNEQDLSKCIKTWTLTPQKFYMPNPRERLQESYVFLRSPHLSPNEQCLLRPSDNETNNDIYDEYFGHLRGVVMVSCKSLVPLALGGADFDGDLVKIISDRRVVNAVKKLYTDSYERTLPVIKIPSAKAKSDENIPRNITFELVAKTFSNQVGHISNIAVNLINLADSAETEDERKKFLQLVAEAAIIVGLEIDAVKTGKRPTNEIKALNDALKGKPKSLFLKIKKKILDLKSVRFTPIVTPDDGQLIFYTSNKNKDFNNAAFSVRKQDTASYKGALIDLLPQFYLEHLRAKADKQNHDETTANKSKNIYFEFQREKTWKAALDNQALAKVEALAKTFNAIRRLDKESESFLLRWEKKHRDSDVNTVLDIQYDNAETKSVSDAKKQMYLTLQNLKDVDEALKVLRKKNWHLTSKDERTDRLKEILKLEEIDSDVIDLLSNFRENGYMLIFYALCECKVQLNTEMDVDEGLSLIRDSENDKWKTLRELIASVAGNSYWKNFYDKYRSYRNDPLISRKKFKQSLAQLCRNELSKIFDGNFDEALKYFWAKQNACDPSHNFFWDVFDEEEIIRNLPKTCRQGVDENA